MTAQAATAMVIRAMKKFGVRITWKVPLQEYNSRGVLVNTESEMERSAIVLLLKERFSVLKSLETVVGLSHDYTRYLITLPSIDIKQGTIITDNHDKLWKVGVVDWVDVAGKPVFKQMQLIEQGNIDG